ncbi:meiosis protein SPO22/ZIP4 like-domain-containing protein [Stachybotrys elegans]|uniref:Meiosis protein SPO22/ZIP4 like-domain-containing protein n=1 Tax=Stachybotrys elegans TaxID=80388 RepID=A0A8K0SVE0_9HYPO|nr:meiosis protein SPO22/ZIP4 like-domain-containing protein [Stachybotrys elegans]
MADRNASKNPNHNTASVAGAAAAATNGSSNGKSDDDARSKDRAKENGGALNHKSPKKRRKVNHACVYCRRSHMTCDLERPCTRCIKRNIGHLCHDEPREGDSKKPKNTNPNPATAPEEPDQRSQADMRPNTAAPSSMGPPPNFDGTRQMATSGFRPANAPLAQPSQLPPVRPPSASRLQGGSPLNNSANGNANQFAGFSDAWMTAQNFNNYNHNYMIAPEFSTEFNLLNDFLHASLLDDNGVPAEDSLQSPAIEGAGHPDMLSGNFGRNSANSLPASDPKATAYPTRTMLPPPNVDGKSILRGRGADKDKTREYYYLQAADPSGNDTPEERMDRVLTAKYEAGLLKPFNYINGYARLGKYLDGHIAPSSKQKILRTINQFRPKFREKAQGLTDIQLVYVEMWFEKQLMDYDRVFASMAVPACCWRRTGEIFRGNKEMAELINVPVDDLRDGKIALHEILTEESMVRYWEEFGTIAFDPAHDTLLTACALKNPSDSSDHPIVKCCFSFMIRRDDHKIKFKFYYATMQGILAISSHFATELRSKLPDLGNADDADLISADIGYHVNTGKSLLEKHAEAIPPTGAKRLERSGRDLWNTCVRQGREQTENPTLPDRKRILARARLLGYQLIALAREGGRGNTDDETELVYMLDLVLHASRVCLDASDTESARWTLQRAADYTEGLRERLTEPNKTKYTELEAHYLTLRTILAWKENRLDVAEHMFNKTSGLRQQFSVSAAENLVDALHHIGQELSSNGDVVTSIKWLQRGWEILDRQKLESLSVVGLELRLSLGHTLIQTLLSHGSAEYMQQASELVTMIEDGLGDKPIVLHWRLEILQKSPQEVLDVEAYASIIRRMIRTFDFSESSLQFILHHVKKLAAMTLRLAALLLDELITKRVVPSERDEWIDKTLVQRAWLATTDTDVSGATSSLKSVLDTTYNTMAKPLSPEAAGAIHSDYKTSEVWAHLAFHPACSSCGESNLAKFGRKLIIGALAVNEPEKAYAAFQSMPPAARDQILTRYLMFKVSLQNWDTQLGSECIEFFSNSDCAESQNILYACIREAQQAGHKICTLAALRAVIDGWDSGQGSTSNLPSLIRCAIRLTHLLREQSEDGDSAAVAKPELVSDLCERFRQAAWYAQQNLKDEDGNTVFTLPELHWFRKNAYNMGLSNCHTWEPRPLIRIFDSCVRLIQCYPKDLPLADLAELNLMSMRCHFVISAALVSLARTDEVVQRQLQLYTTVREHVVAFYELMHNEEVTHECQVQVDLLSKLASLFVFDFEAAVRLENWEELAVIVRKSQVCQDEAMYKAMGDCLLRSSSPPKVLFTTLRIIINEIYALEGFDSEKLAKYIRCIFQAILPLEDTLAFQILEQAAQIAQESRQGNSPFPSAELEWLVATSFNHAIDFYARGEEDLCHRWAHRAMDLAIYLDDGGVLGNMLQERFAKLRFEKLASRQQAGVLP